MDLMIILFELVYLERIPGAECNLEHMKSEVMIIEKLKIRFAFKAKRDWVSRNQVFKGCKSVESNLHSIITMVIIIVIVGIVAIVTMISPANMRAGTIDEIHVQIVEQNSRFLLLKKEYQRGAVILTKKHHFACHISSQHAAIGYTTRRTKPQTGSLSVVLAPCIGCSQQYDYENGKCSFHW